MWNLPEEITEKILLGVAAFDLIRCKAVCKGWLSLISSADFVAAHLERAKSDLSSHQLLVHNRTFDLLLQPAAGPFLSFTCFSSARLLIIGSANGLICVVGKGLQLPSPDDIWILNPVTGLSKKLPYSSRLYYYDDCGSLPKFKFAFWCDDDKGVYKVAKFLSNPSGKNVLELWVSTSPDTWTDISTFILYFHHHRHWFHACDVLIKGKAAYWIVVESYCEGDPESDDEYGSDDDGDDVIIVVSLDLKTLALTKFKPISEGILGMRKPHLREAGNGEPSPFLFGGNLNGEFVLVSYNFSAQGRVYDIRTLGMGDDTASASWIKKYTLCFDDFPFEKCLGIVNHKLVLTSCEDQVVALCDPVTGMMEVVETGSKLETTTLGSAHGFVGSLVSMDGFGFEWNYLLRKNMGIKWPYSLCSSTRKEEGWRMNNCKRRRR